MGIKVHFSSQDLSHNINTLSCTFQHSCFLEPNRAGPESVPTNHWPDVARMECVPNTALRWVGIKPQEETNKMLASKQRGGAVRKPAAFSKQLQWLVWAKKQSDSDLPTVSQSGAIILNLIHFASFSLQCIQNSLRRLSNHRASSLAAMPAAHREEKKHFVFIVQ